VPLPETIPVKYTEEEAEYLSVRPLVRQTFRSAELVDMILSVTGKNVTRIQQILRSGTVVFHFYRYWWQGFESNAGEISTLLEKYPNADPSRPFRAEECSAVLFETGGSRKRRPVEVRRVEASKKRFLRGHSFWDSLMNLARAAPPSYREYSYAQKSDVFSRELSEVQGAMLASEAALYAPRELQGSLKTVPANSRLLFLCPRS
jgi:hypothetical protein